jgi:hypothetical protein
MTITVNEAPKVTVADFSSGAPIAGLRSPQTTGDYRQLARLQNHIMQRLGTGAPAIQQWWTDGGCFDAAGSGWVEVCRWRIPILSALHEDLRCAVYWMPQAGAAPGATVEARFKSINKGATSSTITGAGLGWRDTSAGTDLALDTTNAYEEVTLEIRGTAAVDPVVYGVCCEYVRPTIAGSFVDTGGGENYPTHDEECAQGMPLSSDLMQRWIANTDTAANRARTVLNWSRVDGVSATSAFGARYIGGWLPHYPGADGMTATVHMRVNSRSWEQYAYISHGARLLGVERVNLTIGGEFLEWFFDNRAAPVDCTRITIPGGSLGETWVTATIDLRPTVDAEPSGILAPPVVPYPGTMIGVFTELAVSDEIYSISIWGP